MKFNLVRTTVALFCCLPYALHAMNKDAGTQTGSKKLSKFELSQRKSALFDAATAKFDDALFDDQQEEHFKRYRTQFPAAASLNEESLKKLSVLMNNLQSREDYFLKKSLLCCEIIADFENESPDSKDTIQKYQDKLNRNAKRYFGTRARIDAIETLYAEYHSQYTRTQHLKAQSELALAPPPI